MGLIRLGKLQLTASFGRVTFGNKFGSKRAGPPSSGPVREVLAAFDHINPLKRLKIPYRIREISGEASGKFPRAGSR